MSTPAKIGGEYGPVRANIDIEKLNAYLAGHVKTVHAPVDVKQFKVDILHNIANAYAERTHSLDRYVK